MSQTKYDIVTVGGGLGGAALATVMAKALPQVAQGIARLPDQGFCGPDERFDDAARRSLFGSD